MTRTWVALLDAPDPGADRCSEVDAGSGVLALWESPHRPHPQARSVDPRIVGTGGPPMRASWVALPEDARPLFDAPEVLEARRVLLRRWPAYGASSMTTNSTHLAGSVVLWTVQDTTYDDPFARLGSAQVLLTEGFFVPLPAPAGPAVERYAGVSWPYDRFPEGGH